MVLGRAEEKMMSIFGGPGETDMTDHKTFDPTPSSSLCRRAGPSQTTHHVPDHE